MRALFLFPLAVVAAAGCSSAKSPQKASVTERDLTLRTNATEVEVASPLELRRPVPQETKQVVRRTHRHTATTFQPTIVPAVLRETVASVPVATTPAAEPVAVVAGPADPHELLPGKTVTIIPASSGPTPTTENPRDPAEVRGGMGGTIGIGSGSHGGGCHGRGGGGSGMGGGGSVPPAILR
jgi:hypothetical protein